LGFEDDVHGERASVVVGRENLDPSLSEEQGKSFDISPFDRLKSLDSK
jgi:hypothetical protein